ncbi:MAG: EamA family transporter [Phycisphaerales bacterium]|nr:EamA family transporter [Phycisphaerales bacterium]
MKAVLFALLAGLCWGVGEIFTKSVLQSDRIGAMTALAVRALCALPLLLGCAAAALWVTRTEPRDWMHAPPKTLAALVLGSGALAGGLALVSFFAALKAGEISVVKPIAFCVAPAVAVLLGWLVLGEPMTARKAAAIAFILVGVVLLTGK